MNLVESKGITELWQVATLSQAVIDEWFPQNTQLIGNLFVQQIQKTISKPTTHVQAEDKDSAMLAALHAQTETMKTMGARMKKDKKEKSKKRKARSRSSSSVSVDEKDHVDIPDALESYALQNLNLEHFPDGETLAKTVAKAKAHYASARKSFARIVGFRNG